MGRFFSNIQIKNNCQGSQQFIELLNKAMEKRGLIPATEEDESISYALAFPENDNWLTLCSPDYKSDEACVRSDVQWLAEALNTCCISTTVVDSDFSILEMYNGTSSITDMVIVGDGSGYGFDDDKAFKGKRECWEVYLATGSTWEQFSEIREKDFTFAEDALSQMAPLIGMNSKNIISDYDDLSSKTDKNIVDLHFKKKEKKNALSLNAAFKQVFGEALEPLGFVKIKGKQPYFVRIVEGGEIIHVITYRDEPMCYPGQKEFCIFGGVATVYRQSINLTISPSNNMNWLMDNFELYTRSNPIDFDPEFRRSIYNFTYKTDSDESMLDSLNYSLEITEEFMLQIFDEVTDLETCIKYFDKFQLPMQLYDEKEDFGNTNPNNYCNEGLLYVKTNNQEDIIKGMEGRLVTIARNIERGRFGYTQKDYDEKLKKVEELKLQKTFTPELHAKTLEELERRKEANTDILRSYGLNL